MQEPLVPTEELGLERLPIYAFIAERCAGRRVLDLSPVAVRCASWLAQAGAARVIVPAADAEAALDAGLALEGLEAVPVAAGEELPFDDGALDVVLLLDRLGDLVGSARDRLVAETRRVLAEDGLVVAGLPDPRVGMLWRRPPAEGIRGDASALPVAADLEKWVGAHFAHVTLVTQTPFLGFSLVEVRAASDTVDDEPALELSDELVAREEEPASYHLALGAASAVALGRALLVQVPYRAQVERVRAALTASATAAAQARAAAERGEEELRGATERVRENEAEIARWDRTSVEIAKERDVLVQELARARLHHAEELRTQAEEQTRETKRVVEELSAERASLLADYAEMEAQLPALAAGAAEALRLREQVAALEGAVSQTSARASELEAALATQKVERLERLQREVEAGAAARERVLAQYDELLRRHETLAQERARLVERVEEAERELDRARERVLAADARLREGEERAARAEALVAERDRALAERAVTMEKLRAEAAVRDQAAQSGDVTARAGAAGTRVLQELMAKLEAAETERRRVGEELEFAHARLDEARQESAAGRGQTQALEDEIARLARELRAERVSAETRAAQVAALKAELDKAKARS